MTGWVRKRFWTDATVGAVEGGFAVLLDGRPLRTPAKAPMVLPTRALAEIVAAEWAAQQGEIDPRSMPATRAANAAIDHAAADPAALRDHLASYGASDLICYRAEAPSGLVARQAAGWDGWLAWAATSLGAALVTTQGVMFRDQPAEACAALRLRLDRYSPFELTGLSDLVTLSGSLILALAVAEGALAAEEGWRLSRIDEDWQEEQWGIDAEAAERAMLRRAAFLAAADFLTRARLACSDGNLPAA